MTIETLLAVLISILIGLSGWILYTVHGLAVSNATREAKSEAQDDTLREDRARIMQVEEDVAILQVDVATLKAKNRH